MDRAGSRGGHWYLIWVGGVDAQGVLVVDIGDPHLAAVGPPDGDDHVLADGHGQHRVALVVDVLPDQIHPPCSNSQSAAQSRGAASLSLNPAQAHSHTHTRAV